MKEEIPTGEIRNRTASKSSNEGSKLSTLRKNYVNDLKLRDKERKSEAFNGVSKEMRTKMKTSSVEGIAKNGDQTSVRAPARNPIGLRTEATKKGTGIPILEIHGDPEFACNKSSVGRMNSKLRTSGVLAPLKQSPRSVNLDSGCNPAKQGDSCCPTHEIRHLKRLVKGLQETEETLRNELLHEQKELCRTLHKVTALEKGLSTKCTEIEGLNMMIVSLRAEYDANIQKNSETTTDLEMQAVQVRKMNAELETKVFQLQNMTAELAQQKRELADKLAKAQRAEYDAIVQKKSHTTTDLEIQVIQLQNMNAELEAEVVQLQKMTAEIMRQKREMENKLAEAESQILAISNLNESKKLERSNGMCVSLPVLSRTLSSEFAGKHTESKDKHTTNIQNEHDKMKRDVKKVVEKETGEQKEGKKEVSTAKQLNLAKFMYAEGTKRPLRIPNPPPKPSLVTYEALSTAPSKDPSGIPPPPPPPKGLSNIPVPPPPPSPPTSPLDALHSKTTVRKDVMQKSPEVVQFYRSLMRRDSKNFSATGNSENPDIARARSSMIGEIENRSAHLLAIKEDVETQGDFVRYLIRELQAAAYANIEDVLAFVQWLDEELSFLVDERAVLKHFDWPEKKADTMREAAFAYWDLKKLQSEVLSYVDNLHPPCDVTLKRMTVLLDKLEHSVYNLLRTRERTIVLYKVFQIPVDWMLDSGIVSEIKLSSVKLAKKYMKRISIELESMGNSEKDPTQEFLLLQGVRFAFRAHQIAGGFDAETMSAFEELRHLAHIYYKESEDLNYPGLSA